MHNSKGLIRIHCVYAGLKPLRFASAEESENQLRRTVVTNVLIALCVFLPLSAAAQQPAFEVASIKRSNYQGGPYTNSMFPSMASASGTNARSRRQVRASFSSSPQYSTRPGRSDGQFAE
jgi:hypothetical protein